MDTILRYEIDEASLHCYQYAKYMVAFDMPSMLNNCKIWLCTQCWILPKLDIWVCINAILESSNIGGHLRIYIWKCTDDIMIWLTQYLCLTYI